MANILTYLWTLLTDLPGALRHRAPARLRPNRAEGAAETRVRTPAPRPRADEADDVSLDAAGVERALAEFMALFAQWQAGTLPPAPPPAPRYVPHPSWQPIQLRRRPATPEPPAAPAPPAALRPAHARKPCAPPSRPLPAAAPEPAAAPPSSPNLRPAPPRAHSGTAPARPASRSVPPRALRSARAAPAPVRAPRRGQAPTRRTTILLRNQTITK